MEIKYTQSYWDNYYNGSYETTYKYGFNLYRALNLWKKTFKELPVSFADIGCGPGYILRDIQNIIPEIKLYGVEVQNIPKERCVSNRIIFGDFIKMASKLEPVNLLYVSCSMYIPWKDQEQFLRKCVALANKAVIFGNLYLEDGKGIPEDSLRKVIYRSRKGFQDYMQTLGLITLDSTEDFFLVE